MAAIEAHGLHRFLRAGEEEVAALREVSLSPTVGRASPS